MQLVFLLLLLLLLLLLHFPVEDDHAFFSTSYFLPSQN